MNAPRTIIIDFETFYDKDYHLNTKAKGGLSFPLYIHDPRFKVHGLAVDDGKGQRWIAGKDVPAFLKTVKNDILVAHNGFFDFGILAWHYKFTPAYMLDTLLLANHVFGAAMDVGESNRLADLAARMGLTAKMEMPPFMKGLREPDEAQMAALAVYAKHDAKLGRQVLNLLLPQVTNADFEFWVLDHTLRIYLFKPLDIDKSKLAETVEIVKTRQEEIIASAGVPRAQLASDKQFAALMRDTLQAAKIKMPMKKPAKPRKDGSLPLIPALSKSDPAFIKLTEHPNEKIANVVRARLAVRSAATIAARLLTMQKYADLGIGIPVHLIYYGAHTGRFAGGGGFNFQNLTSPDRATTEIDRLLAQLVRQIIVAGPGKVFVPVDAAQIEARVLAWLAGEQQILDTFATGADIYSEFISEVLGEKIHKPKGDEPKAHQQHLKLMRGIGKIAVLGLGYSMAAVTFFARQLSGNKDVYKKIEAGEITMEFAEKVVQTYREKYTKVVKFWKDLDNAFHDARKGMIRRVGFLTFKKIGPKAVGIVLPNGRMLSYRNIRSRQVEMAGGRVKTEWLHGSGQKVYGGLLAENVTQAVARDILVEQGVYAAEMAGYPVYLHVHDEVVPRVEESKGKVVHDFLVKSLSTAPEWAPGLVLSAEGKVGKDLGK